MAVIFAAAALLGLWQPPPIESNTVAANLRKGCREKTDLCMKPCLIACFLLWGAVASAQKKDLSLDRLLGLSVMAQPELAEALGKRGFKADPDSLLHFAKSSKAAGLERTVTVHHDSLGANLVFSTIHLSEFEHLAAELKTKGFVFAPDKTILPGISMLYQKADVCAVPSVQQQDGRTWYRFSFERKRLPAAQDIKFIEDLAQLSSHEHMAAVFGPARIRRDLFYFSDNEVSKCSILFPNTAQQVIVVWKDQQNNRGISLLVVGGRVQSSNSAAFYRPVEQSPWQSVQGIYPGMTLRQLQEANGAPLDLYGWDTEEPGVVNRSTKGNINFKILGVQLNCLDCNEDRFYSQTPLINSASLLQHNRRVYVATIVYRAG